MHWGETIMHQRLTVTLSDQHAPLQWFERCAACMQLAQAWLGGGG